MTAACSAAVKRPKPEVCSVPTISHHAETGIGAVHAGHRAHMTQPRTGLGASSEGSAASEFQDTTAPPDRNGGGRRTWIDPR